jgi:hypothetical protein
MKAEMTILFLYKAWNTQTGMKPSLQGPSGLVCSTTTNEMMFAGVGDDRILAWTTTNESISSAGPQTRPQNSDFRGGPESLEAQF